MKRRSIPVLALFLALSAAAVLLLSRGAADKRRGLVFPPAAKAPGMVAMKGAYSKNGYSADLGLWFPRQGGRVSGLIEGACRGTVDGRYSREGGLSGQAVGSCRFLFADIHAQASIEGSVDPALETGVADFTATALGQTLRGTVRLSPAANR